MKLAIHYFSATGNTSRAMELIKERFENAGNQVAVYRIERELPVVSTPSDITLVAFPILAWSAPTFVHRYLRKLPKVKGAKAAVFATFGGGPGFALARVARILKSKGYDVFLTGGALYPDNWTQMMNPPEPEKAKTMIAEGDLAVEKFVKALVEEKQEQFPVGLIFGLLSVLVSVLFRFNGRRFLGKAFTADSSCNGCGLCARTCPVGTITMKGGTLKRPHWNYSCADCGRCINICPKSAIQTSVARLVINGIFVVATVTIGIMSFSWIKQFIAGSLSPLLSLMVSSVGMAGIILIGFWLVFQVMDRILFQLEKTSLGRRFFSRSHTNAFRRYRAPGFHL